MRERSKVGSQMAIMLGLFGDPDWEDRDEWERKGREAEQKGREAEQKGKEEKGVALQATRSKVMTAAEIKAAIEHKVPRVGE